MAQHDPLPGAHEAVIAGLRKHVGLRVGVVASVKVRSADTAGQDVDNDLAPARFGRRQVDGLEL